MLNPVVCELSPAELRQDLEATGYTQVKVTTLRGKQGSLTSVRARWPVDGRWHSAQSYACAEIAVELKALAYRATN